MNTNIKVEKITAKSMPLKPYCHHSDDSGFIEVTEWSNGEGFNVVIAWKQKEEKFALTHGQFRALMVLGNMELPYEQK